MWRYYFFKYLGDDWEQGDWPVIFKLDLSPFLRMGTTSLCFQSVGHLQELKYVLKINVRGDDSSFAHLWSSRRLTPLGFLVSILRRSISTSFSLVVILLIFSLLKMGSAGGFCSGYGNVCLLEKCLANASVFFLELTTTVIKGGILSSFVFPCSSWTISHHSLPSFNFFVFVLFSYCWMAYFCICSICCAACLWNCLFLFAGSRFDVCIAVQTMVDQRALMNS